MVTKNEVSRVQEHTYPVINMGMHLKELNKRLDDFEKRNVINRIWHKDHTVWKKDPTEISNRLGWLQIADPTNSKTLELETFAKGVQRAGFKHIVLLGMGGSSLGPEVLRKTFGSGVGYPELIVLDSTYSASVEAVTKSIDIKHTLFLVSSKSGTTTETLSFYRYFRNLADLEMGREHSGANFVAITDIDTPLARMAEETRFRRVFINSSDIGGRYSVLTYFGMVPAALSGIDISRLLENAGKMQDNCAPCVKIHENPGVWLGVLIGLLSLRGQNKLSFLFSPSVSSFGMWVEQLLAESTGKEGKGIVPIIDEPLVDPKFYGDDRVFVYLRVKGDDNNKTDEAVTRLEVAGQPVIQFEVADQNALGAEFFRWELATAVAGAVMGINPFDQPDVQSSKDATRQVLNELKSSGSVPRIKSSSSLKKWLGQAQSDNYVAVMSYLKPTSAVDRALSNLRKKIIEKYHVATTLGYGPRYLHSTGQLHKGGPDLGMFLQIVSGRKKDLRIPDETYTFNTLTEAEAQGDYRALESKGRKIIRVQVRSGSGKEIESFML